MKFQESIRSVLVREPEALRRELKAYGEDEDIWRRPSGIGNSAGNLALHLAGNLQSFVGTTLGATDYVRDRQAEFSRRDVPRAEVVAEIEQTIAVIDETLSTLADERLSRPFPLAFGDTTVSTGDFLIHLSTHLAFHVGQVDYHRRLITGENESIGPLAIPALASARATE